MKRHVARLFGAAAVIVLVVVTQAGADAPTGRYTISAGTVYDTKTRLTWQQESSPSTYTWEGAKAYCTGGWRLPTVKELQTLVDDSRAYPGPVIDTNVFPRTQSAYYWSSTPHRNLGGGAQFVDFRYGLTCGGPGYGAEMNYVRCVR